jgi:hypothetical protein
MLRTIGSRYGALFTGVCLGVLLVAGMGVALLSVVGGQR